MGSKRNKHKGYGFIEFMTAEGAEKAKAMNNTESHKRNILVRESHGPNSGRPRRSGRRGRRGKRAHHEQQGMNGWGNPAMYQFIAENWGQICHQFQQYQWQQYQHMMNHQASEFALQPQDRNTLDQNDDF